MTFSDGDRVLVPDLGRQGKVIGFYRGQVVVKLDVAVGQKAQTRPFAPEQLEPLQDRAPWPQGPNGGPSDTDEAAPRKAKTKPLKMTSGEDEEDVQAMTIAFLQRLGYRVWQTTVRYVRQRCPTCGDWIRPSGGYGASKGVPDLLIAHDGWGPRAQGVLIGIEMKNAKTALSPEQKGQWGAGRIVIARSHLEAAAAVRFIEAGLFGRSLMPAGKGMR